MYVVTVRDNGTTRVSPDLQTRLEACKQYAEMVSGYDVVRTVQYCKDCYELVLRSGAKVQVNIVDLDAIEV